MGKLISNFHKNKNNTDMLVYQIYLPNLHANVMKRSGFDLLKVGNIVLIYGSYVISGISYKLFRRSPCLNW